MTPTGLSGLHQARSFLPFMTKFPLQSRCLRAALATSWGFTCFCFPLGSHKAGVGLDGIVCREVTGTFCPRFQGTRNHLGTHSTQGTRAGSPLLFGWMFRIFSAPFVTMPFHFSEGLFRVPAFCYVSSGCVSFCLICNYSRPFSQVLHRHMQGGIHTVPGGTADSGTLPLLRTRGGLPTCGQT